LIHSFRKTTGPILVVFVALILAVAGLSFAQTLPQTSGVDNSKMGAYRALAQHAYAEFQKGDLAAAAQIARSLERVWDKAEDYGGDMALHKTHPDLFEQIDKAMDAFVTPLEEYKTKAPDAARLKAAFNNYMEKLKLAD
jgi:hypothetical protein